MKAITAATIFEAVAELRLCMNPASIIWPVWRDPEENQAQQTVRSRRRSEAPVTILNPDRSQS